MDPLQGTMGSGTTLTTMISPRYRVVVVFTITLEKWLLVRSRGRVMQAAVDTSEEPLLLSTR